MMPTDTEKRGGSSTTTKITTRVVANQTDYPSTSMTVLLETGDASDVGEVELITFSLADYTSRAKVLVDAYQSEERLDAMADVLDTLDRDEDLLTAWRNRFEGVAATVTFVERVTVPEDASYDADDAIREAVQLCASEYASGMMVLSSQIDGDIDLVTGTIGSHTREIRLAN